MAVDTGVVEDQQPAYPVRLAMVYPEKLSRLSTAFRILLIIPVVIFVALITGGSFDVWTDRGEDARQAGGGAGIIGGGIVLAIWATILVRGRIPHWLFDFRVGFHRFTNRAAAYAGLLTDRYPAFEGDWDLQYDVDYPDRLSRWKIFFWKLMTSIPHFILLFFLAIAAIVCVIIAWFAILITGAFPRGLHRFVVGVLRWSARVNAYFESLTDVFPPYSLDEDAGPGSQSSQTISAIIGGLIIVAVIAIAVTLAAVLFVLWNEEKTRDVNLGDVLAGSVPANVASIELDDVTFTLRSGSDPADVELLAPRPDKRLVRFTIDYSGEEGDAVFGANGDAREIGRDALRLETDDDSEIDPLLLTFDGIVAPVEVAETARGTLVAVFEIDADETPEELRAYPDDDTERHVAWELR